MQKLMGHKVIEMTQRYAKLAPSNLVDAVSVLEPQAPAAPPPTPALSSEIDPAVLQLARRLMAEMKREQMAPLMAAE